MSQQVTEVPYRRGWPLLGVTPEYVRDPLRMMQQHYDRYGPVSEVGFVGGRWTVLLGPDACGAALVNADKAFANGPGWGFLVGPFFRRGLMLLDFAEHHQHRRLLQEAFTRDRLTSYAAQLGPAIGAGVGAWEPQPGFRAHPALKSLTLDLATRVFMGGAELAGPGEMERVNRAFIACVQAAQGIVRHDVPGTRWGRATRGRAVLEEFLRRHLPLRRAAPGDDLFSVLCHLVDSDGGRLRDEDVVNHMIFLLMAAHDTSTITVTTILEQLGRHPDWQQRCREESDALPGEPDLDQLGTLRSLDLVMRESLRLVPPVPVLARRTVKDTEVLGIPIPAGRLVSVMVHLSHHLEELWTEPERFDPERFAEGRREDKSHRYAWEPFGGGVHKCLGMAFGEIEVKLVVHQLLRRFTWSVEPGYRAPLDYMSLPFPKDGLPVDLRRRDPARAELTRGVPA